MSEPLPGNLKNLITFISQPFGTWRRVESKPNGTPEHVERHKDCLELERRGLLSRIGHNPFRPEDHAEYFIVWRLEEKALGQR